MPVVFTYKQEITAKNGSKYVIYRGLTEKGDMVEAFLTAQQAETFSIPDGAIVTKAQLKEIFDTCPVSEIFFNQRGRVENIKA